GRGHSERRADASRGDSVSSPDSPGSVVMKFGGTSVADADAMTRVVNIVRRQWESQPAGGRPPVVVVSALSKVTDWLIRTTELARNGEGQKAAELVKELLDRHVAIARTLTSGQRADDLVQALGMQFGQLGGRVIALGFAKQVTPVHHDMIVAM